MDPIETVGQILPCGDVIEPVCAGGVDLGLQLLHWDGQRHRIAEKLEIHGSLYKAANLDPTLLRATRLPSDVSVYGGEAALVADLAAGIQEFSGVADNRCRLIAFFVLNDLVGGLFAVRAASGTDWTSESRSRPTETRFRLRLPSLRGVDLRFSKRVRVAAVRVRPNCCDNSAPN
jgi:hypothetical protein